MKQAGRPNSPLYPGTGCCQVSRSACMQPVPPEQVLTGIDLRDVRWRGWRAFHALLVLLMGLLVVVVVLLLRLIPLLVGAHGLLWWRTGQRCLQHGLCFGEGHSGRSLVLGVLLRCGRLRLHVLCLEGGRCRRGAVLAIRGWLLR